MPAKGRFHDVTEQPDTARATYPTISMRVVKQISLTFAAANRMLEEIAFDRVRVQDFKKPDHNRLAEATNHTRESSNRSRPRFLGNSFASCLQ